MVTPWSMTTTGCADRGSSSVTAYLEEENEYTSAMMASTADLQEGLYAEMLARIQEDDSSAPSRDGEYLYYARTEEGRAYPIHCRKHGDLTADEEVLLDVNELAEEHDYFRVGDLEISPDHRLLAYSYDTSGDEKYVLVVKDLATGELLSDRVGDVYYSLAWAADNKTLFYTTPDAAHRPWRLHRHVLGTEVAADVVVLEEPDERFFLEVSSTRSRQYVIVDLASSTTSEVHFLEADRPGGSFRLFAERRQGVEYDVDHRGDRFYVLTNLEAKNFRLMETPSAATGMESWRELIGHRADVTIEGIDLFRDRMNRDRAGRVGSAGCACGRSMVRRSIRSRCRSPSMPSMRAPTPSSTRPTIDSSTRPW